MKVLRFLTIVLVGCLVSATGVAQTKKAAKPVKPAAAAPKPAGEDKPAAKPAEDAAAAKPDDAAAKPKEPAPAAAAPAAAPAKAATVTEVTSKDFVAGSEDPNSPVEKPSTTYRFIGARFRETWIPKFMISLFGDGGNTVSIPMFGPEVTIRRNHFEYVLSAMYSIYSLGDPLHQVPFKAKTDPDVAYELVDANLKVLYLESEFLWSTELDPTFAIDYGAGLGVGLVFGDIHRQQAHPVNDVAGDPYQYVPCEPVEPPPGTATHAGYCGSDNNHYGNYTEKSWADGGSKPIIFPWLAIQTGFRYKPTRQFMARFDLGWNLFNGPFVGLGADYGL
jgi:hypothetical protein